MTLNNQIGDDIQIEENQTEDEISSSDRNNISNETITLTDDLTASVDTLTDDLTSSVDRLSEEENNLLNNYKYSVDVDENIGICVNEFIKLMDKYSEISIKINNVKTDIHLLPELMSYLKEKNHKLMLNIMDNPQICFQNIFNIINNNYMNEYMDSINQIQSIMPNYDRYKIYEALQVCNNDIEMAINYLYEN